MRIKFQQKLDELKERLLVMAGLVEQAIQRATEAYSSRDMDLCELVSLSEPAINRMEHEIDQLALDLQIADNYVTAVRFQGRGCAISQASASMLSEMIEGKTTEEIIHLGKDDILDALGIPISPARTKCAFLCLRVLHGGLAMAGLEKPGASDDEFDDPDLLRQSG